MMKETTKRCIHQKELKTVNLIQNKVMELDIYKKAKTVMLYMPVGSETDTSLLLSDALNNKTVCVPFCEKDNTLSAYSIKSIDCLKKQSFGILEPDLLSGSVEPVHKSQIDNQYRNYKGHLLQN